MKHALVLIGLVVVLLMFGSMVSGVKDSRSDSVNNSFIVSTVSANTANVTLTQAMWTGGTSDVVSITSTNVSDAPLASAYTSATRQLTVAGLEAQNATRTLTVNYLVDALSDHTGTDSILKFTPLLFAVGVVAILIGLIWKAFGK